MSADTRTPAQSEKPLCQCFYNPETGYFEPCCEAHEQEYVKYLRRQRDIEEGVNLRGAA